VELSLRVMTAAGIKVAAVRAEALPATVDLSGEVVHDPDRTAQVAARAAGRVLEVRFKEGDRVAAGELLAVVESPELARARAAVTSTEARARSARQNAARLESLAAKSLAGAQEVATASAEAAALDAEAAAARQALAAFGVGPGGTGGGAARLQVRSPIAGYVLKRDGVRGQTVAAGHVLGVIGDLDRAYFVGRLFEKDVGMVKAGAAAEVRLNAFPKVIFAGVVETVGKQLDPAARTVTARISIRNQEDLLKAGLFGTARVVVRGEQATTARLAVPVGAVTQIAGHDVVFVQQQGRSFELHPVTLGRTAGGKAEVLEGLREGERVVVDGVFSLKSAVLKSSFAEEE
jgi:cobalt-zinc-cadmium efflux system membrane fusion protein